MARIFFFNQFFKPEQGLWIDVGSGAGTYSRILKSYHLEVVGLDYSPLTLHKAQKKENDISWVCANAYAIPIKSQLSQGCLCFGVLQALEDEQQLITELSRILKPNGQLWIDGLNQFCLLHLFKSWKYAIIGKPKHLRYANPWQVQEKLRQCGYQQIELYWAPIFPKQLSFMNRFFLKRSFQTWLRALPWMASLVSHSFYIHALRGVDF